MATIVSEVLVQVGGDTSPLRRDLKKGTGSLKKFGTNVKSTSALIGKFAVAALAAQAAITAFAVKVAESNRELQTQAKLANTSVSQFKSLAFAAKSVNVEQDKLSDILKDVNDRIGDFVQTGGGPMADFFEKVGPKVGVTADHFKDLSGPQALQLYISSLEKANLSQADMTFFMEAMASDSTKLLGLYADSGAELARLTGKYDQLNKTLDLTGQQDKDLEKLAETFDLMKSTASNAASQIAGSLSPELEEFAGKALVWIPQMTNALIGFMNQFRNAENLNSIAQVQMEISRVSDKVNELNARFAENGRLGIAAAKDLGDYEQRLKELNVQITELQANQSADIPLIEGEELASVGKVLSEKEKKFQEHFGKMREMHGKHAEQSIINRNTEIQGAKKEQEGIDSLAQAYRNYAMDRIDSDKMVMASEKQQAANRDAMVSAAGTAFGNLSTLMSSENKKQFEIGKKAAKAQAVVDTYASAQAAFKSLAGIPIIGPALGYAAAGAAVVAGFSRVRAINATSFGGGGGSGGGASSSGGGASVSSAGSSQQSTPQSNGTLTVEGLSVGAILSGDAVAELATTLLDYQREGGRVVLAA